MEVEPAFGPLHDAVYHAGPCYSILVYTGTADFNMRLQVFSHSISALEIPRRLESAPKPLPGFRLNEMVATNTCWDDVPVYFGYGIKHLIIPSRTGEPIELGSSRYDFVPREGPETRSLWAFFNRRGEIYSGMGSCPDSSPYIGELDAGTAIGRRHLRIQRTLRM